VVADPRAASGTGRSGVRPSPPDPLSRSAGEGAKHVTTTPPVNSQRYLSAHGRGARSEGKLRPLNQPRPVSVETDEHGAPIVIERRAVEAVIETWRVEDEWWRPQPVRRAYWRLLLEDGRTLDVYRDVLRGRWYRQAYSG
jgi:hypothetical protein